MTLTGAAWMLRLSKILHRHYQPPLFESKVSRFTLFIICLFLGGQKIDDLNAIEVTSREIRFFGKGLNKEEVKAIVSCPFLFNGQQSEGSTMKVEMTGDIPSGFELIFSQVRRSDLSSSYKVNF